MTKIDLGDTGPDPKDVGPDYCGDCGGASKPASGCCNTCEDVRQAYVRSGWAFSRPEGIEQVISRMYFRSLVHCHLKMTIALLFMLLTQVVHTAFEII